MQDHVKRNVDFWRAQHIKRMKQHEEVVRTLRAELSREPKPTEVKARIILLAEQRRSKFLLKEGRATIAEIIKAHKK